jgi:hypothetical protein
MALLLTSACILTERARNGREDLGAFNGVVDADSKEAFAALRIRKGAGSAVENRNIKGSFHVAKKSRRLAII